MGRYPLAEYLLFEVLYLVFFYPTRQETYRTVILTTMICLATQIYLTQEVMDMVWVQYSVGFMVATRLTFIAYILLAEGPFPNHWRRVRDETRGESDVGGLDKTPSDFPLRKKLWWMVDLACGMRMIGWVQEQQNLISRHPPPSRRTFLKKTFLKLIVNIVISDLTTSVLALSPPFDYRVHDPADGPETYLAAVPLLRRVPYVLAWSFGMGTGIITSHSVGALVCVGLGRSSPTLWPDIWGKWGDAYTIRKFWGYVRSRSLHSLRQMTRHVSGKRGTSSCEWYEHTTPFLPMCCSDDLVLTRCSRDWEGSLRMISWGSSAAPTCPHTPSSLSPSSSPQFSTPPLTSRTRNGYHLVRSNSSSSNRSSSPSKTPSSTSQSPWFIGEERLPNLGR